MAEIDVRHGDCRDVLATLPDESVHCVVTSPPYWGLRDYGVTGQLGLEATPDEHVAAMVGVFREVRRVLRSDGTLWLNYGDCYYNGGGQKVDGGHGFVDGGKVKLEAAKGQRLGGVLHADGLKAKDLVGMPWRIAFALQADGWWLRSDIIWHKPNPMPESVTDRPTSAHEHVFLLSKSARYFYDAEAVREDAIHAGKEVTLGPKSLSRGQAAGAGIQASGNGLADSVTVAAGRNLRNVWTIATAPFSEAHFATFPPALVEPCIKAGTSERGCCPACGAPWVRQVEHTPAVSQSTPRLNGDRNDAGRTQFVGASNATTGWSPSCAALHMEYRGDIDPIPCTVLDPFGGAGTVGLVADRLQRNAVLIELNPEYAAMARNRLQRDAGLFAQVALA